MGFDLDWVGGEGKLPKKLHYRNADDRWFYQAILECDTSQYEEDEKPSFMNYPTQHFRPLDLDLFRDKLENYGILESHHEHFLYLFNNKDVFVGGEY